MNNYLQLHITVSTVLGLVLEILFLEYGKLPAKNLAIEEKNQWDSNPLPSEYHAPEPQSLRNHCMSFLNLYIMGLHSRGGKYVINPGVQPQIKI